MSTARRGRGEGTIRKRADGRFEGQVSLGTDDLGRYVRKSVYGRTRAEVVDKLAALRLNFNQAPKRQGSIAELLERWLMEKIQPRLRPNTFRQYDYICRLWIVPFVGAHRVEQFDVVDVEALLKAIRKGRIDARPKTQGQLIPGTARILQLAHVTLHAAFRQAVRWKMMVSNPCNSVDVPIYEAPERVPLNLDQSLKLRDASSGHRFYAAILLPLATGVRPGEVFGLLWKHVDLKSKILKIEHTLISNGGHPELGPPKTKKSIREVALPDIVVEALQERRLIRIRDGHAASPYVFCDINGNPIRESNFRRDVWLPLLAKAGIIEPAATEPKRRGRKAGDVAKRSRRSSLALHFHDLRHTFATDEIADGKDIYALKVQMGHGSTDTTTRTYAHKSDRSQRAIADRTQARLLRTKPD